MSIRGPLSYKLLGQHKVHNNQNINMYKIVILIGNSSSLNWDTISSTLYNKMSYFNK